MTRVRRILVVACATVQWALLVAVGSMVLAWFLGQILTDQYAWSQWVWWIPTLGAMVLALVWVGIAAIPLAWRGRWRKRGMCAGLLTFAVIAGHFVFVEHRFVSFGSRDAQSALEAGKAITIVHWNLGQTPIPRERAAHAQALIDLRGADIMILTAPHGIMWHKSLQNYLREGEQMIHLGKFTIITRFAVGVPSFVRQDLDQRITALPIDTREELGRGIVVWMVDLPSSPFVPRMQTVRELRGLIDERCLEAPDLVLGDFNIPRGSASIDALFSGLHHAYADSGFGYSATFERSTFPLWHIDHILLGPNLRALDYEVIDTEIGRHHAQRTVVGVRE